MRPSGSGRHDHVLGGLENASVTGLGQRQRSGALADHLFQVLVQEKQVAVSVLQGLTVAQHPLIYGPGTFEKKRQGSHHHEGQGIDGAAVRPQDLPDLPLV
jgi:hypothetical protein